SGARSGARAPPGGQRRARGADRRRRLRTRVCARLACGPQRLRARVVARVSAHPPVANRDVCARRRTAGRNAAARGLSRLRAPRGPSQAADMTILDQLRAGISTASAAETQAVAAELAKALPADTTLALHGDLGVGKTTFVQG